MRCRVGRRLVRRRDRFLGSWFLYTFRPLGLVIVVPFLKVYIALTALERTDSQSMLQGGNTDSQSMLQGGNTDSQSMLQGGNPN